MPLRLAYLVSRYPTTNHTFILREIRQLREEGWEIEVISISPADRPVDDLTPVEREEQQRTRYVKSAGGAAILGAHLATLFRHPGGYLQGIWSALTLDGANLGRLFANLFYFAEAVVAGHWMRQAGLTHCHTHFSSTVALLLGRVFPVTWSATIHGPDEFNEPAGFHLAVKCDEARFVIAISQYGRSQLMRWSNAVSWPRFEVCPLGVDPSVYEPVLFRPRPEPYQLICVGRLAPQKAQRVLIEAVASLAGQGRAVHLRIVGGGPDQAALQQRIAGLGLASRVTLTGALNQDEVLELYRQTDIFALASFAEGVPVVLMEAMAMQIPCVTTWITGVPELIRDGVDGLLVPPSDPEALAAAIARLMDDPDLRQRLGQQGRQRVLERYDLTANTRRLAEIFNRRLAT
jgi:glycosyltransferase involved in cell wall biosynthesis